jgi:hypothetical protein
VPISIKLGTKHTWVKRIQNYWNKEPGPFQRGDNFKNAKIGWWALKNILLKNHWARKPQILWKLPDIVHIQVYSDCCPWGFGGATVGKITFTYVNIEKKKLKRFSSITRWPISNKLGMKEIQICWNKGLKSSSKGDNPKTVKIDWNQWNILFLK